MTTDDATQPEVVAVDDCASGTRLGGFSVTSASMTIS